MTAVLRTIGKRSRRPTRSNRHSRPVLSELLVLKRGPLLEDSPTRMPRLRPPSNVTLDAAEPADAAEVLEQMDEAAPVTSLLAFPYDTAGGIMNLPPPLSRLFF